MAFEALLQRSDEFATHLLTACERFGKLRPEDRYDSAATSCALSMEHGQALRVLFVHGAANSACGLMRLQYEALLRAGWLLYAASPEDVERARAPLSPQGQRAAQKQPGAKEMLDALVREMNAQPALTGLVQPLRDIREQSWAAMNSFVHAGMHPLRRTSEGFPIELADNVIRQSNGMAHMAVRLLYRLSITPSVPPTVIENAYRGFEDCLPAARASANRPTLTGSTPDSR